MIDRLMISLRPFRRPGLIAALLVILACGPAAVFMPALDRSEARTMQMSVEMQESHRLIQPYFQNATQLGEPMGIHWAQGLLVSLTSDIGDRSLFSYRLASILGAILACFALVWGAKARRSHTHAMISGGLAALSLILVSQGFMATASALFSGLLFLSMSALSRLYQLSPEGQQGLKDLNREKLVFWGALGLSFLVVNWQGPVMIGMTIRTLILWDLCEDRKPVWLKLLGWQWGVLTLLILCGPWIISVTIKSDGAYWARSWQTFLHPSIEGFTAPSRWPHWLNGPIIVVLTPVLIFPGAYILIGAIINALNNRDFLLRLALVWTLVGLSLLIFFPTQIHNDPLPCLGGLFWLCGDALTRPHPKWLGRLNLSLGFISSVVVWLGLYMIYSRYDHRAYHLPLLTALAIALCLVFAGALFIYYGRLKRGLWLGVAGSLLVCNCLFYALSSFEDLWISQRMEQALIEHDLDPREGRVAGPVAVLGYAEPSFVFAMGTGTEIETSVKAAMAALQQGRPVFVDQDYVKTFLGQVVSDKLTVAEIETVSGFDYVTGKVVRLKLYRLNR